MDYPEIVRYQCLKADERDFVREEQKKLADPNSVESIEERIEGRIVEDWADKIVKNLWEKKDEKWFS